MSYQRQLEAGMRNPGSAGLTLDRLGVEDKWEPKDSGRRDGDGGNSQDSGNSCLETGSTEKQPQGYAERSIM